MTYSIVARDPSDGSLGIAVQSKWFAVGHIVPWVNAGVGVVATQALAEPSYGPKGLTLMRSGLSATRTLEALIELDSGRDRRQVAMIDANGVVASHTGSMCIKWASHASADGVSCQGNILHVDGIPDLMLCAYQSTHGELIDRLLAAVEAAEAAGGDARGRQSAAVLVVAGTGKRDLFSDRAFDVRIDDHPDPIPELRRIVDVQRAYRLLDLAGDRIDRGETEAAIEMLVTASKLMPYDVNVVLMSVWGRLLAGDEAGAREMAARAADIDLSRSDWNELVRRMATDLPPGVDPAEFLSATGLE